VSVFERKNKPTGLVDIIADVAEIPDGLELEGFFQPLCDLVR